MKSSNLKRIINTLLCLSVFAYLVPISVYAQLTNTGAYMNIPSGTYINAQCNIVNENGLLQGIIENEGTIITSGDMSNNASFLSGNSSTVLLNGSTQLLSGAVPYVFNDFVIDGSGNKSLATDIYVENELLFNAQKIFIGNNSLILGNAGQINNAAAQRFVITDGSGSLVKKAMPSSANFLFPVGDNPGSYKPVLLSASGAVDTFAVRVANGLLPADQTAVQKTYIIKQSNPLTVNSFVSLGWNTSDEGSLFQTNQALIWQKVGGAYTIIQGTPPGALTNTPATDWKYTASGVQFQSLTADSFIVKSSAPPVINSHPSNQIICENGTISFAISATGLGVLTYQWQINCSGSWSDISNGGTIPQFVGANDTTLMMINVPYAHNGCSFRCVVSNIAGSVISAAASLAVHPAPPIIIVGDSILCEGDTTTLTAQTSGIAYLWTTTQITQNITVTPLANQNYAVTVTDLNGCSASDDINVHVTPQFNVSIASDFPPYNEITQGQLITFNASPTGYDNYEFLINNNGVQSSLSVEYTTADVQDGDMIYIVATVGECTQTDSLKMKVKPVANAFTPFDMDGKNDLFAKNLDLVIFNRWAQVLYTGKDGWDGTYEGKNVSPGTYFYLITINEDKGAPTTLKGTVVIVTKNN